MSKNYERARSLSEHCGPRPHLIGAIVGDIAGSRFEWRNCKSKDFTLLVGSHDEETPCRFTDDSVMTLAIADAIMKWREGSDTSYAALSSCAIKSMQAFGRRHPNAGYGGSFRAWLQDKNPRPYNSWGNGAAMRVSACGWVGRTLDEVKAMSRAVTEVTHNHPEGIKGAEATAVATFLARTGKAMGEIREVVVGDYYPLDFTLDKIRSNYEFDVSCQGSVPQALEAFFESTSFEDAIRNAISIGGDSDTIGAICGAVAGGYYGVPDEIRIKSLSFLDDDLIKTLVAFDAMVVTEEQHNLVGCEFRHFKGNRYRLEGFAKDSETMEEMVIYRALYDGGGLWVRPAKMFFETIERDGKRMKRFELMEGKA